MFFIIRIHSKIPSSQFPFLQDNAPATPSSPIVPEVPRAGSLQDLKLTSIGGHQHGFTINPVVNTIAEELFEYRDNPDAEREVLEGIDKNFFEDDYDAARFEIEVRTGEQVMSSCFESL